MLAECAFDHCITTDCDVNRLTVYHRFEKVFALKKTNQINVTV